MYDFSLKDNHLGSEGRGGGGGGALYVFTFSDKENVWDNRLSMPKA